MEEIDPNWQSNTKKIVERSTKIYHSKRFADCSFQVGSSCKKSKVLSAHKVILAMSSAVFDAMLFGPLSEEQQPIRIPDIEPSAFDTMLRYIYTDVVDVHAPEDILGLWVAAEKYLLSNLAAECTQKLNVLVDPENVWTVFHYAVLYNNRTLKERCEDIIAYGGDSPFTSGGFINVPLEALKFILDLKMFNVDSEVAVFRALEQWAVKECQRRDLPETTENLREVSKGCVKKIRFLTMTSKEFVNGPARSRLLTKDECYSLLLNIIEPEKAGSVTPLPSGFCSSLASRAARAPQLVALRACTPGLKTISSVTVTIASGKTVLLKKGQAFSLSFWVNRDIGLFGVQFTMCCDITATLINPEMKIVRSQSVIDYNVGFGNSPVQKDKKYTIRAVVNRDAEYRVEELDAGDFSPVAYSYDRSSPEYQVTLQRPSYDPLSIISCIEFLE